MEKGQRIVVMVGGERQRGWFVRTAWGGRAIVVFEALMTSPRYACTVVPAGMVEVDLG